MDAGLWEHGLPIDTSGNTVSVIMIKAARMIAENPGNELSGDSADNLSNPTEQLFAVGCMGVVVPLTP
jgi:hypothetical protein